MKNFRWPGSFETTTFGGLKRSALMARVRSHGNKTTEEALAILLRTAKVTGWKRNVRMLGKPDFLWRRERLLVFVDGCFWHGHGCGRNLTPKTNPAMWRNKIRGNQLRDRRVTRTLKASKWTVVRLWECTLRKNPEACLGRVLGALGLAYRRPARTSKRSAAPEFGVEFEVRPVQK